MAFSPSLYRRRHVHLKKLSTSFHTGKMLLYASLFVTFLICRLESFSQVGKERKDVKRSENNIGNGSKNSEPIFIDTISFRDLSAEEIK